MAPTKPVQILLVGAGGHIGAAVLEALSSANLPIRITALVRSNDDLRHLNDRYNGRADPLLISLNDTSSLIDQASKTQIIINCAPDVPNTSGISTLLSSLSTTPHPHKFYIATSGAARIWSSPDPSTPGDKIWDDLIDLPNFPINTTHAATDIQVQSANSPSLHTAIVSPCFVIGKSPSKSHRTPITFPDLHHVTRSVGAAWSVGPGENLVSFVDTFELANLYVLLVEDALEVIGDDTQLRREVWGEQAYYFGESGMEISFRGFMQKEMIPAMKMNEGSKGWIKEDGVKELELEDAVQRIMTRMGGVEGADLWSRHIAEGFGTAMRIRASRARKYLGWKTGGKVDLGEAVEAYIELVGV
ncbi:hypothetical protein QBC38DRAFT_512307 [Podospora fimiseda]|uniref:Saccharopine dehydrogenase NADP binding domain-containing protein n=1 Tax=Podospora fimiseda TaxID=252190 RepID=A0AAN7GV74_9PEZI|nr:hypothetical protein QBC38DRAFT_512307 [Podospora fimiseda]